MIEIEIERVPKTKKPEDSLFLQFGGQPSAYVELDNINN